MKKIKYRYSGDGSKDFWKLVNSLEHPDGAWSELYSLGVALQNLEEQVLQRLREELPNHVEVKSNRK